MSTRAFYHRLAAVLAMTLASFSLNANTIDPAIRAAAEQKVKGDVTSAIVFTDANLISLGVVDFNPNSIIDLSEVGNAGDDDTLQRRSTLRSYTLPWESDEIQLSPDWTGSTSVRLSYVNSTDNINGLDDPTIKNPLEDIAYLFASDFNWKYQINPNWKLKLGAGGQLMWMENTLTYRDPLLTQVKPLLDDVIANTSYGAIMLDPSVQLTYTGDVLGHKWEFISGFRYAIGRTVLTDNGAQSVTPRAGRWSNSFVFHYELPSVWDKRNEMRFLFKRIDLSGDAIVAMSTTNYYEVGAGWIIDSSSVVSWLETFGIGITLNINSGLSGGGVVFLINEEF
ncbi:Solitary outer membrane autotransporter beta-barrel domain [Shewanella sp. Isolate11]|uniref:Solitary outer membrane autotransporter beta-barrel domain n=1 Tax=Shewanella sp. Isolate11 TaxID=2908530 RepID=UPI001EFD4479|nr:Solitary outer membrane autotransporter beta-barrel domain [Shewanella sp. Isolate11]MCG9698410.1 Solitary outer membrane autotransporter beta-barrel domain [Shewanella sp. Isolate11]